MKTLPKICINRLTAWTMKWVTVVETERARLIYSHGGRMDAERADAAAAAAADPGRCSLGPRR